MEWATVIDANDHRAAVAEVGDAGIGRQRHGGMRRSQGITVEDLAVCGFPAMKSRTIPGRQSRLGIVRVFLGVVPLAGNLVFLAETQFLLTMAEQDYPDITFHKTSEFKLEQAQ